MKHRGAIQRWIGAGNVLSRAQLFEGLKGRSHRVVDAALAMLLVLFAGPVAAQSTTVTITGADRPSFSREGQPLTFHVRLDTGNTPIDTLTFTSGSPSGMSGLSCPGLPADLMTSTYCTFTYTTTAMDVAMGKVTALGRWRVTRPTGAARNGSTNTLTFPYAPPREPDAPDDVTATAGDGQATVAFDTPFDGGYPIDSYTVTSSPGGYSAAGTGSPMVVGGLTNGVAYRFTVRATSSRGTSTPSVASADVTPKAAQTITFANPGVQTFGTTPTLTASASSSLPVAFTSGTTGVCTVDGAGQLTFVAAGTCTIHADQAGDGTYAAAPRVSRSFTVAPVLPGAPTIGSVAAGDGEATVNFTAPAFTGGTTVTGYTVTATPDGITATGATAPITVTGLSNGTAYTFTVTATNSAGTGAPSDASTSVVPDTAPGVTSVTVPAPATYATGQSLDFTVHWDQSVTITGAPGIGLTIGATSVQANYLAGSGSTATTFRYVVQAGQIDADGITVGTLSLNGGSIRNSNGQDAVPTLNSVGDTSNVLVGAVNQAPVNTVPGPQSTRQDAPLVFSGGNAISVSDPDAGTGIVEVALTVSNGVLSLQGTGGLSFATGDGDADPAMAFTGRLADINAALAGLRFVPTAGYSGPAILSIHTSDLGNTGSGGMKTDSDTVAITVMSSDTTAPTVAAIDLLDASPTGASSVRYRVRFSEPVTGVDLSDFSLVGVGDVMGTFAQLATPDNIEYTVTVDNVTGDGALRLDLLAGSTGIIDRAGNGAPGYTGGPVYVIDRTSPTVTGVLVPAAGQYIAGQSLVFTLTFSEAVNVTGTPGLPITFDVGGMREAAYVSGSGTDVLVFSYTVAAGDQDLDGPTLGSAFVLNGGAIADLAGAPADANLHGVGSMTGVVVGLLPQAITGFVANPVAPIFVPNGTFTVSATGGASGLPVTYASATPSVCSISGDTVTMIAAGTCSLTADQAGNASYAAAPQVTLDVAIGIAAQAITGFSANPAEPVYSRGGTFVLSAIGGASGLPVVFASNTTSVCTVSGSTVTMLAAGTCSLTADQAGNASFSAAPQIALQVVIGRALPTLAWVADMSRTLGEAAFELPDPTSDSAGAFTFTSSDPHVATISGRTVTLVGAGVTTLVATQAAAGNYAQASVSIVLAVVDRPDPTRDASVVGGLQAQVDASVRFVAAQQSNIQNRMRQLRFTTSTSNNALTLSMASLSGTGLSISADELASFQDARLPQGMAIWTAGTITSGGRDADGDADAFDFRSDGVTLGADWRISERFVFGVAGGWGWNDTDLDEARSNLDAQQRALSLYGLWRPGERWFVDGIVGWGDLDFDIRRYSATAGAMATAQRNGDQSFGALTGGYEHAAGDGMTLTGYGRLDASRTRLDAYREQGLGLYDLAYGSQTVESSGASLGVEGSFPILTARGDVVRPYWMLEYRESLDNRSDVDLNYVILPVDDGYALGMRSFGDNALTYGGGIDLDLAAGWKLSLLARRQHGDGQRPSSTFGLTLTFSPATRDVAAVATDVEATQEVAPTSPSSSQADR
ncbi:autotransporter domain-containing protein [Lysobacter sp.]|uniref:autotransporter domain-containing protein n=1 Tax=Lysobacter sp. TaxID=72226 RepID=UPI002D4FCC97|nr:autotransporter domain-containing protein [Lysobacter sp.]HZX75581.1 autotransporter domain-containing protein [Lysobacter sp.]